MVYSSRNPLILAYDRLILIIHDLHGLLVFSAYIIQVIYNHPPMCGVRSMFIHLFYIYSVNISEICYCSVSIVLQVER